MGSRYGRGPNPTPDPNYDPIPEPNGPEKRASNVDPPRLNMFLFAPDFGPRFTFPANDGE